MGATHKRRPTHAVNAATPENLLKFMLRGWQGPPRKALKPDAAVSAWSERRRRVSQQFPGELIAIPTGERKVRANDTYYRFRPGTEFYYLTGIAEPDCILIFFPQGAKHHAVVYAQPNTGKSDATFFLDRHNGELWEGPRLGLRELQTRHGIDCRPLSALESELKFYRGQGRARRRSLRGLSASADTLIPESGASQPQRDAALCTFLSEMRLIKEPIEIEAMSRAARVTGRAFEDVIAHLKTARTERELESVFCARARMEGNDVGYTPIVAAGPHACTLHWQRNDGALRKGELLLLDAGIELDSLYTADITRTLPISGKFSVEQRAVYDIVLEAHEAALRAVKPGHDFLAPHKAAMVVLARGLKRLRILSVSAENALRDENQFHRRYSLHNVSHMLGMEVHDCAHAHPEMYKQGKLAAGMVLTIEPGLYFQPDDLTVPAKYRGIGVRIEDDVLVTANGRRLLSADLPRNAVDVERWMRRIWSKVERRAQRRSAGRSA
jgi:Xaa-Pro aminopeptidase